MYYDGLKKIARSLPCQTLFVKWGYNGYMVRNHFSKHGGPYFINDGFSHHTKPDSPIKPEDYIKPSPNLFYGLTAALVLVILGIGIALVVVS